MQTAKIEQNNKALYKDHMRNYKPQAGGIFFHCDFNWLAIDSIKSLPHYGKAFML